MADAPDAPLLSEISKRSTSQKVAATTCNPKLVDTVLAGLCLFGSCYSLALLERTGLRLFAAPMIPSAIIFFHGPAPPNPRAFLNGTLCSATICLATLACLSHSLPPAAAQGAAAGLLLMWYKATGAVFPPAVGLAGLLVAPALSDVSGTGLEDARALGAAVGSFLCFPWLAGHAWLWGCAYVCGKFRSLMRVMATKANVHSQLSDLSDGTIRSLFNTFDTSKDGEIDAHELKVALRAVLGMELENKDCERLVRETDKNGTGKIDIDEFVQICRDL